MAIIYTHTDADGKCAGAIVYHELCSVFSEHKYHLYNYKGELVKEDDDVLCEHEDRRVFITDLSINDEIIDLIHYYLEKGWKVLHFDHHTSTMTDPRREELEHLEGLTTFYVEGISGCMISWIFSCMSEEEQKNPNRVQYDFSEGHTHVALHTEDTSKVREYKIPMSVRYIDDNDVWRHEHEETKYFAMGLTMEKYKNPFDEIWKDLLYSSTEIKTLEILQKGEVIFEYQEQQNENAVKYNSFVSKALDPEHECLCLNSIGGNSRLFGDKFAEYPVVCKFGYDGNEWFYTIYSNEQSPVDCAELAKRYGGGGHRHAAGFRTKKLIFEGE